MAIEHGITKAIHNLGHVYEKQNKLNLAEKYYLMAVDHNNPTAMDTLGGFYYKKLNKLDLAEKYYLMAIEHNNFNSLNNLGILYHNQNKLDLAEKYFLIAKPSSRLTL